MDDWWYELEREMAMEMRRLRKIMEAMDMGALSGGPLNPFDDTEQMAMGPVRRSYGFRIIQRDGEEPIVEQWGDIPEGFSFGTPDALPRRNEEESGTVKGDPMLDINETDDRVTVTMELPGFTKEDINLYISRNALVIEAKNEDRDIRKVVPLPSVVDEDDIRATYKNGVLDVSVAKSEKDEMKKIDIE